jgi:hypothetical protein
VDGDFFGTVPFKLLNPKKRRLVEAILRNVRGSIDRSHRWLTDQDRAKPAAAAVARSDSASLGIGPLAFGDEVCTQLDGVLIDCVSQQERIMSRRLSIGPHSLDLVRAAPRRLPPTPTPLPLQAAPRYAQRVHRLVDVIRRDLSKLDRVIGPAQ